MHRVIKVLARAIRQQKDIKGKQIGKEFKLSLKRRNEKEKWKWHQFTQPGRQNLYMPAEFPLKERIRALFFSVNSGILEILAVRSTPKLGDIG